MNNNYFVCVLKTGEYLDFQKRCTYVTEWSSDMISFEHKDMEDKTMVLEIIPKNKILRIINKEHKNGQTV